MTPRPDSLAIVVLNWNSAHHTAGAVQSLPPSWRDGIIIADNGSADQDEELATLRPLGTRIVSRRVNAGFAVGMNMGLRAAADAGFTHAVMVNSDSRPTADAVLAMHELIPAHALVGIAQVEGLAAPASGTRYVTAAVGRTLTPRVINCAGCEVGHHEVDVVSGAVMLVHLDTLASVGWIDEEFFHYKEEVDMAYRIRQAGHRVAWVCSHEVAHEVGGTVQHFSPNWSYYRARNEIHFFRKHGGLRRPGSLARLVRNELTFLVQGGHGGDWFSGVRDGITRVTGARQVSM